AHWRRHWPLLVCYRLVILAWWRCSVTMISAPCRFISTSKLAPIAARTARSPR
ncbi:hypothetical protein, partial [Escherichia coli]|uniref:hypothetical protein n=1 Tax=Escherichia coli TaxID=562 RepID=UPI0032EA19EA